MDLTLFRQTNGFAMLLTSKATMNNSPHSDQSLTFTKYAPSIAPVVPKVQHEPQMP